MLESIKKTLLTALRAMPLTIDEVEAVIDGLQEKGDLTEEQGRKLRASLLGKGGPEAEEATSRLEREIPRFSEMLPFASRRDLQDLAERVSRLEERLAEIAPEAPDEVPPSSAAEGPSAS